MKHKFISKRYWKDISTPMGASDGLSKKFDDVINLSLGDPDLITDEIIIDHAFEDAKAGHTKYTDFRGDEELRKEIANYYKEEYNLSIQDEEIMVTASGCIAMYLALEAILDDQDEVIIHTPCFTPYPQQIVLARGVPVAVPTYEEDDFQLNIENLENAITERTKAIIINSPCNPTGNCFSMDTLKKIAAVAVKYDLIVITDEIYGLYSYAEPFVPFISLEGMRERTITINSFSKDYTMTGWRVGNIIAPDYIIATVQAINENVVFTAPSVSQRAAIYAIRFRKEIQPKMLQEYKSRVLYAAERIHKIPNLSVLKPKGTFYLFVNIKATGLSSVEVANRLLLEAHVNVIPGIAFGSSGEGYVRIACTVNKEKLGEAFDRIEKMDIFQHKS